MKRTLALLMLLTVCILSLSGCAENTQSPVSYAFEAQYIRTNRCDDTKIPTYALIHSRKELDAYYEANKNTFDLERKKTVFADTTIGFLDACDKYDDAYFETHNLLLIVLEEPSGSIRHQITDVRPSEGGVGWTVTVKRIRPSKFQTDDMAAWHLFLEIQMGKVIAPQDPVTIQIENE